MLSEQIPAEHILVGHAPGWREAVQTGAQPLLDAGHIEARYIDAIISNVEAPGGTYMDLGLGFMLAHARPEAGAIHTALTLLVLDEPVDLADDPTHPVKVIITLAAEDPHAHLQTMANLAELLTDERRRTLLLSATTVAEVTNALRGE